MNRVRFSGHDIKITNICSQLAQKQILTEDNEQSAMEMVQKEEKGKWKA